jgi:hypothetical protein
MQTVSDCVRRLENQLVLEKARPLAIQRRDRADDARITRELFHGGTQIDHRIETVEAALSGLHVILPSATNVSLSIRSVLERAGPLLSEAR